MQWQDLTKKKKRINAYGESMEAIMIKSKSGQITVNQANAIEVMLAQYEQLISKQEQILTKREEILVEEDRILTEIEKILK